MPLEDQFQRAYELCRRDVFARAVRKTLLDIELLAHATGWDGPDAKPRLFQLDRALDGPMADYAWTDAYNEQLYRLVEANGGRVGVGLTLLGDRVEQYGAWLRGVGPFPMADADPQKVAAILAEQEVLRAKAQRGDDLAGPANSEPGFQFFGYGLRSESWDVSRDGEAQQARAHRLHKHLLGFWAGS